MLDILGQNEALVGGESDQGVTSYSSLAVVQELVQANLPPRLLHGFKNEIHGNFFPCETFLYAA